MPSGKIPTPTVEEAERVINHLLSYPDECEETLDAVRYVMQWLSFDRPTEASLFTHARLLRKPLPEGIREGVDRFPTTRHRTTMIVEGVLKGYLKWLRQNHPETGDDVDPDAPNEPHPSHHILVHDNLGGTEQQEVCGYCGKTDDAELREPCPEAERMNRDEDRERTLSFIKELRTAADEEDNTVGVQQDYYHSEMLRKAADLLENPCADIFLRSPMGKSDV